MSRFPTLPALTAVGILAVCGPIPGGARAQEPAEPAPDGADIRGTWLLEDDGTVVSIYDLRDYMPDGSRQLTFFEPTSGRLRTLHPEEPGRWTAGPAWFAAEPVELVVESPPGSHERRPDALVWREGETVRRATRIRYPVPTVRFRSGDTRLEGSLILPPGFEGDGTVPAIVLVAGSGRATREVPRSIGELFARAGVAAFVYDKRGTGSSEGDFARSTVADFGRDAAAAVAAVAMREEVDPDRVGVMLASQGGLLLPAILDRHPGLALVVCRVCPVRPGTETSLAEARGRLAAAGLGDAAMAAAEPFLRAQQRYALTGEGYDELEALLEAGREAPWFRALRPRGAGLMPPDAWGWSYFRDYLEPDPWSAYAGFEGPVLGVFGALDRRVPAEVHAEPLRTLLAEEGHRASEVRVLEDATHGLLLVGPDGSRTGPFTHVVPGWHDALVEWVARRLDAGAARAESR